MIETPSSIAFQINEPASDGDKEELDTPFSDNPTLLFQDRKGLDRSPPVEPELLIVKSKPITATIRSTIRHLRAQAGRWSRFRGIVPAMVHHTLQIFLFALFSGVYSSLIISTLAYVATSVILGGLNMAWTHIVISAPSRKRWWQRIPSVDRVKVIVIPTAVCAIAEQLYYHAPRQLCKAFGIMSYMNDPGHLLEGAPQKIQKAVLLKGFLVVLVAIITGVFIVIPATITLRRVQASMLPDEDEAIVPFDRTFNGKVQPVVAGGSGAVSMLDAWKTFDWFARIRFLKLQAKLMALFFATSFMFAFVFLGERKLFTNGKILPRL